ncbi:MAG: LysM peptidoglycan-binding domain-containing protein [Planctomycetes bacterium]|nr:LysM peptidoglycan-binding domain-containing protein [Planctomycetota bacterium]
MSQTHVVKSGETLSSIAALHGFGDFRTILDDPANAALRALRGDGHVLAPGDEVVIPDRVAKKEAVATAARSTFVAAFQPLHLRVRVRDLDDVPLKSDVEVLLATGGADDAVPLKPGKDGLVERPIERRLERAELRVEAKSIKADLVVGGLDPIETLAGQRARLNNLGYFAGYASDDREQFRWGAEEFEKDKKVAPGAVKDEDIDLATGLASPAFRKALVKEHGS